jgi:hypothetical protein
MFGLDVMAAAAIPEDRLRSMRVEELARALMISLAANPKALEWSENTVAMTAFKLAASFDEVARVHRK